MLSRQGSRIAALSGKLVATLMLLLVMSGSLLAQSVPAGTVVKVRLLSELNSEKTRVGDRIRVQVAENDRSGLNRDTVFVGRVTEVQQASKTQPGVIDIRFGVIERNGSWQNISGGLHSLSESDVREDASGRLVGKQRGKQDKAKFIGYGAAGGAVIGYLLKKDTGSAITGGLVGALAGYLYGESQKDKQSFQKVDLKEGAEFGIILDCSLQVNHSLTARR
jgi:hypothetical protein